jgi:multidrug efflux pump subunit AcrB
MQEGLSGKIANFFINSKLTILLMVALMIIGSYSSFLIPREEEPQINVPMADVLIGYPGATPQEVEKRIVKPLEQVLSNIKGIEHIHSMAMNGQAMIIVQFYVGQDIERSYVKLYDEMMKHSDMFPSGVMKPVIKTRSIDDVPMLGLTLWSDEMDEYQLRQLAEEVTNEVEKIKGVAVTKELGGAPRVVKVTLDNDLLKGNHLDAIGIMQMIQASNSSAQSGGFVDGDQEFLVTTGEFFSSKEDLENLVIGTNANLPVYLRQVAKITDGSTTPKSYVSFGYGKNRPEHSGNPSEYPAVTISVAKVKGADAMQISEKILEQMEHLKKDLIPDNVKLEVTRNYGETASDKVSELTTAFRNSNCCSNRSW